MEKENLNRFDRIVAIHLQLQSKRTIKAQELADRFHVSLRTIYRDIRSLEASGVPIVGEAGLGYSLMEGYRLPPVMFTREEAGSFVAAEKLMQHYMDKNLGGRFESAMFKIKSVLRGSEKDWVTALDSHISIRSAQNAFNEKVPNALELLFESLAEKKQVVMNYQSVQREQPVIRNIEPVGLFHENRHWYILGYCHLRKDYRQFRIDRIQNISRSGKSFIRKHGSVEKHRQKEDNPKKKTIKLLVDKEVAGHLKYDRDYFGFISEEVKGGQIEMTFEISEKEEGFARWFLMFGDHAQILEPENLKVEIEKLITRIMSKLMGN